MALAVCLDIFVVNVRPMFVGTRLVDSNLVEVCLCLQKTDFVVRTAARRS